MDEQIEKAFTYQPVTGNKADKYKLLRDKSKELAYLFSANCPQSRELSLAFTKLEEAIMWVNAGIARNKEVDNV